MKIIYSNPRGPRNSLEKKFISCLRAKHQLGPTSDDTTRECMELTKGHYTSVPQERANELAQWFVKDNRNNANKKPTFTIGQRFDIQREKYTEIIGKKETELDKLSKEITRLREENNLLYGRLKELENDNLSLSCKLNTANSNLVQQPHKYNIFSRKGRR